MRGTLTSSFVILALSAAPAPAAEDRVDGSADVAAAMQRDLGLTPEQARVTGGQQERALKLDTELQVALGDAYAGSQYDIKNGVLTVMVSDRGLLEQARAAGAEPRLVTRTFKQLDAIKTELDGAAATRPAPFTSWSVDPVSNSVVVTATRRQAAAAQQLQAKYGDAVSIEFSEIVPETTLGSIDGGDAINNGTCSAGFNLRNKFTGQGYLLTAGHCIVFGVGSTLTGQGGVPFGPVVERWYPIFDFALARKTNAFWIQGPWVDTNPSNGGVVGVSGSTTVPLGFPICKSGITTKWTCGIVKAKHETVNYSSSEIVTNLTRHTACAEPGDSGGANVSVAGLFRAEGVTSGGAGRKDANGRHRCLEVFGLENRSLYFPVATALSYYGPEYGVTTW